MGSKNIMSDDTMSLASQATTTMTFASLPAQVTRKSAKRGFEFNLMVVGESGLGKSTLVSSLFNYDIDNNDRDPTHVKDLLEKSVEISPNTFDIEDKGVKLRLTVVDCLNYGDALDCTNNYQPIIDYIDRQFALYYKHENGFDRKNIVDTRVHCLFYFISPFGFGLKPLDRKFLKEVHERVNIVPIIAKSDALSPKERLSLKKRILDDFTNNQINIYQIPDPDPDEVDIDYKQQSNMIKAAIPFAVCSREKNEYTRSFKDRHYPWGKFDIDNPEHSDFPLLKSMLIMHMSDLKDVTKEVHYERFRLRLIQANSDTTSSIFEPSAYTPSLYCQLNSDAQTTASSVSLSTLNDTESLDMELKRREEELMKLKKMKEEMQKNQQNLMKKPINGTANGKHHSLKDSQCKEYQDVQDTTI